MRVEGSQTGRCSGCVRRRVATSGALYAAITAILLVSWSVFGAARRGRPPVEITVLELIRLPFTFAVLYLCWRWVFHYAHEPRPRTRYVLRGVGWLGLLAGAGAAVSGLAASVLAS